jgi:hypothetical protein
VAESDRLTPEPGALFMNDARWRYTCAAWGIAGCVAALLGVVIGIVRATDSVETNCTGGDVPPCHAYPHAAEGLAIITLSVALFALVVLAVLITTALPRLRPAAEQ